MSGEGSEFQHMKHKSRVGTGMNGGPAKSLERARSIGLLIAWCRGLRDQVQVDGGKGRVDGVHGDTCTGGCSDWGSGVAC